MATVIGCGSSKTISEKLVPAGGMVKLDGKPTEGITLSFQPIGSTKGVGGCWAVTDKEGKYKVMHITNKEGLPPGQYEVLISRKIKPDGTPLAKNESPTLVQSQESIAKMYSDPSKSGNHNRVDVPEKGAMNLDFTVSSIPLKKAK